MLRNEKTSREDIAARSIDMTFYIHCRFIVLTLAMLISKWRNYPTQRAFPIGKIMDSLSERLRFVAIYVCLCMCVCVSDCPSVCLCEGHYFAGDCCYYTAGNTVNQLKD